MVACYPHPTSLHALILTCLVVALPTAAEDDWIDGLDGPNNPCWQVDAERCITKCGNDLLLLWESGGLRAPQSDEILRGEAHAYYSWVAMIASIPATEPITSVGVHVCIL